MRKANGNLWKVTFSLEPFPLFLQRLNYFLRRYRLSREPYPRGVVEGVEDGRRGADYAAFRGLFGAEGAVGVVGDDVDHLYVGHVGGAGHLVVDEGCCCGSCLSP